MYDDPKEFIKRFIGFSMGPVVAAFIGFITVPVSTYFVAPDELGKSAMFTMAMGISALFVFLGMDQSFVREFNTEEDKKNLFWNSMIIPFLFSIIIGILYVIYYKPVSILMFDSIEWYIIVILSISLPFSILDRFNMLVIRMEEKARLYSAITILSKVIGLITLIGYLKFIDKSFKGIINAAFLNLVLICIIETIINREYWKCKFKFDKKLVDKLLKFGLPLIPASVIYWLFNSMDKLAMRKWSTFSQIGLYSAAFKIVLVLGIVQTAFSTFWSPTAYRWYENKIENSRYEKVSEMLTAIMSFIFVFIVLFKDLIIRILSARYADAAVIIPFLLFYPLMYTISETTTLGISFSRKTKYNIIISIVSALVNYAGNYILVPEYGALGASISTGIAYIVFFWMRTLISRKLWYKFNISIYFWNILFMTLMSFENVIYNNTYLNIGFTVIVIFINRKSLKYIYSYTKGIVSKSK